MQFLPDVSPRGPPLSQLLRSSVGITLPFRGSWRRYTGALSLRMKCEDVCLILLWPAKRQLWTNECSETLTLGGSWIHSRILDSRTGAHPNKPRLHFWSWLVQNLTFEDGTRESVPIPIIKIHKLFHKGTQYLIVSFFRFYAQTRDRDKADCSDPSR
jgi:hypothetical protein